MQSGYRIRPCGVADLGAIRALLNALQDYERAVEVNRAHWADGGAAYADWMLDQVRVNDGLAVLAEAESVIGLMSCWRVVDESDITVIAEARMHLYVSDLIVVEPWRGRGVVGALLAEAERHGRALGIGQMTIGVLAANQPARRAYARAGFQEYEMLLRKRL